ncbi:MAG: sulfotransferase [Wenzhouxiangellaceae bacterium]
MDEQTKALLEQGMAAHRRGEFERASRAYETVLQHSPGQPDALHRLAEILVRRGQPDQAIQSLERALESQPSHFPARYAHGSLLLAANQARRAEDDFRMLVRQRPEHAASWGELSRSLYLQDRAEEALDAAREAVRQAPRNIALNTNLGMILEQTSRLDEAASTYRAAIALDGGSVLAWNNLGNVLNKLALLDDAEDAFNQALEYGERPVVRASLAGIQHRQGKHDAALENCRKALEGAASGPEFVATRANVAMIYESLGQLELARATAEHGLQRAPNDPQLNWVFAKSCRRQNEPETALARLDQLDPAAQSLRWRHSIAFERARNLDRLGRHAEAWRWFEQGNRGALEHWQALHPQPNEYRRGLEEFSRRLSSGWVEQWSRLPQPDEGRNEGRSPPVFLVGFPRSGTTLLDQVLNAHPDIAVLEEKPMLDTALERLAETPGEQADALARLDSHQRQALREAYFSARDAFLPERHPPVIVDKLPLNATRVAHIHRLFPDAKFIHAIRHPADVCLSCYMQEFGFNPAMANLFDGDDIVAMYSLVMQLFDRAGTLLPIQVHTVRYEDLVGDLEGQARALLDFLTVDWNERVLDPAAEARRRGQINTPSYHQVTQPIYTDAIDRWKRYQPFIGSWLPALAPWAERNGYQIPKS